MYVLEKVKRFRTYLVYSVIFIITTMNFAFSMPSPTTINLMNGKFDANSRQDRLAIANDLLRTINSLDNFIPNPTPEQMAYIKNEQREIDEIQDQHSEAHDNKVLKLYETTEFQENKLKRYLGSIKDLLSCIKSDLKKEMYCWCYLSYLLVDNGTLNDSLMILKKNKQIPDDIAAKAHSLAPGAENGSLDYNTYYHSYGEGILYYIVLPSFREK